MALRDIPINKDRVFTTDLPATSIIHHNAPLHIQNRIYHTPSSPPKLKLKPKTLILSIHAAVKENGQPGSKASYAVHFAPSSPYNTTFLLPSHISQKSQNAQLWAAQRAIEIVEDVILREGIVVKQVIVKTHSQYVVRCLSEYVGIWRENGWKNASGTAVVNRVGVEKLDELCRDAEEEGRFRVRFWKVGKGENGEAVELAQKGFESSSVKAEADIKQEVLYPAPKPWEPAMTYWSQSAYASNAAQTLCQRLGISLRKGVPSQFAGFTAPLRRLVVTGEDRPVNFERLFGPEWAPAITEEWESIRADMLAKPAEKKNMYAMLDIGAPSWSRPRPPTRKEIKALGMAEGGVRLDLGDELDMLSLSDDSDYVRVDTPGSTL